MRVIINMVSLLLMPFAAHRFADQIFFERAVPFLSTEKILSFSKKRKWKLLKIILTKLAMWTDCYGCTSFIASTFTMAFMLWFPLRVVVIWYGLSGIVLAINKRLNKD